MNAKSAVLAALVAGVLPVAAVAQAAPATPPAAPAAANAAAEAKLPPPSAFPAKIALINFEQAVVLTNEGQRAAMEVAKKYQPRKDKLDSEATEIDSLKKQLQSAPTTMPDDERNKRMKEIDTKDKQYQLDAEDASSSYNSDMQEALSKVAEKVHNTLLNYVQKNGYTLLLNVGDQSSPVMWAAQDQNADITEAIVQAYNAASGVAAPPPPAPAASSGTTHRPSAPRPASSK
ncbi:MAG TPA: OmpH family outer membrane protein [Acidobacteriaceae bacterium]|nr:OmpH family outer membrane protein [Acidobacteriaceae bacterium]